MVLRVRDTGVGISADVLPHIFDMFSQSGPFARPFARGTGYRPVARARLVELHGGTVEAFSDGPGRGSEFVVRLPLANNGKTRARREREDTIPRRRRRMSSGPRDIEIGESLALPATGCQERDNDDRYRRKSQ